MKTSYARDELRLVTRKTGKRLTIPLARPLREHIESRVRTSLICTGERAPKQPSMRKQAWHLLLRQREN
jgi:hypothetical protein